MRTLKAWISIVATILIALNSVQGNRILDTSPSRKIPNQLSNGLPRHSIDDIIDSARGIFAGVVQDFNKLFQNPEDLFESSKQIIAGYPLAVIFTAINNFCSSALSSQTIKPKYTPDITKMKFQLRTPCKKLFFPLLEAQQLVNSPDFDIKKKVVVVASGWTTNPNDTEIMDTISQPYFCRGDTNFIAVDAASFIDTLYSWSAFNTEEIGVHIAEGLKIIAEKVLLENIHLIGHSLGAHIVGAAGRYFTYKTGKTIPRITGLDPAKPCFNEGENLSGLQRGDAEFIDIIHSNSGVLGHRDPLGDVDFYPGGVSPLSPGCFNIVCAHERAWKYYAESVYPGNEKNFMGKRCGSLAKLREGKCTGMEYSMGYAVPSDLVGNFYLEVEVNSPYGEYGNAQRSLELEKCGICQV